MDNRNTTTVQAGTVTLYPVHWAIVNAYAKDMGYPSTSAALRRIIDEWEAHKREPLGHFYPESGESRA